MRTQKNFYRQLHEIGNGFDWTRTLETYNSSYYQWTQWLFVELFKAGLAYRKLSQVNWCPSCKTVLADEQVVTPKAAGKLPRQFKTYESIPEGILVCERCGTIVERKDLKQWYFRITSDADRLLKNLKTIDWPVSIKRSQSNWIGKKSGITVSYKVENSSLEIDCWTSRPETNFGATFIVIAPGNPIIAEIVTKEYNKTVQKYIKKVKKISAEDRNNNDKKKTGVFTGSYAVNPLNKLKMPIWVSDFVIGDVGTGAVVGVPGHDKRDYEFAKEFNLPVIRVVVGDNGDESDIESAELVQESGGHMINSNFLDGLDIKAAKKKMISYMVKNKMGAKSTNYHLRDWLISRQRYWGPPIPMIYCKRCSNEDRSWFNNTKFTRGQKVLHAEQSDWESAGWYPEENLPVVLPEIDDYMPKGTGRGPLADHPEFYKIKCPACGADAVRETDVSDTFLDSSWYFLRYPSIKFTSATKIPFDTLITKEWLPVDLYFGGAEHSVLHLMYSRFVTHMLYDLGYLNFQEPFPKFYAHGLVIKDGSKMSKSKGNVVNPDSYIEKFGADTLRLYLMFMGPMDGYPDFRDTGIEGMHRFVIRVWDLIINHKNVGNLDKESLNILNIKMHQSIKKVTEDIQFFKYNTAISAIMEYVNELRSLAKSSRQKAESGEFKDWGNALKVLAQLIAPFAPHLAEEAWEVLGEKYSIHKSSWPEYDEKFAQTSSDKVAVQVNGKLRVVVLASSGSTQQEIERLALADSKVSSYINGRPVLQVIFVPGKILNFVLKD
jgi:leucyl-tRNA synthetase